MMATAYRGRRFLALRLLDARWFLVSVMTGVLGLGALPGCETLDRIPGITEESVRDDEIGPVALGTFREEPEIRVRVHKSVGTLQVGGPPRVIVRAAGAGAGTPEFVATPITITSSTEGVTVTDAGGRKRQWKFGTNLEVVVSDGRADGIPLSPNQSLRVDKTAYPGFVTVTPRWDSDASKFDVIVTMGIESYIPGVLTHELFRDWPKQTYQAQAVAARTYALHERWRARRERRVFDVEDTDADQVFGGATTLPLPLDATRATRGMVIADRGRIVRAYYSSTCGGNPASAGDTWPRKPDTTFNRAPGLQAQPREHACQKATFYRWSTTRRDDDVSRRIRAWGRQYANPVGEVGRVREIVIKRRNEAKRPSAYAITDETGREYVLTAEELRTSVNWPIADADPITRERRVHSGDVDVSVYANQITFSGRGWGHGVGMCQWCAKGFADLGWDWLKMIDTFYPGTTIERAY
jgi:stage II sporulation protein D